MRSSALFAITLATCSLACTGQEPPDQPPELTTNAAALAVGSSGAVQLYVYGRTNVDNRTVELPLPEVTVTATDAATGATVAAGRSNKGGFVELMELPAPGSYRLCWSKASFVPGCGAVFALTPGLSNLPAITIVGNPGALHGTVSLADGAPVFFQQDGFAVSVDTKVYAKDAVGVTFGPVLANTAGQYLLTGLPRGNYELVASSGSATALVRATVGAAAARADISLPNRRPIISRREVLVGGVPARRAAPGATVRVEVTASDPDGDPLHYFYAVGTDTTACGNRDLSAVDCTLKNVQAVQAIFVMVSDGRGQYQSNRIEVRTDGGDDLFTGTVVDPLGKRIPGVTVTVNGKATESNADGGFGLALPPVERYSLVLKKPGWQTFARIYFGSSVGVTYTLVPVIGQVFDPTRAVRLFERVDDRSNNIPSFVELPAKALDCEGVMATGPVTAYISTIDRRDPLGRMPGDSSAVSGGQTKRLVSYGAVEASFFDDKGRSCQLLGRRQATIGTTVYREQAASAPATIPLWYYDEREGVWRPYGSKGVLSGGTYRMPVDHFTIVNADLDFAEGDCLVVRVDGDRLPLYPNGVRIGLRVPDGRGFDAAHSDVIHDDPSVIARLPGGVPIEIWVRDDAGNEVPGSRQTVTMGPGRPNPPLTPAASTCGASVTLTRAGGPAEPTVGFFGAQSTSASNATTYYNTIDPLPGTRRTFDKWKEAVGFKDPVTGAERDDARAFYLNKGDLKFGRSMHMIRRGADVAYYVTNFDSAEQAARDAAGEVVPAKATVAMEYSAYPNTTPGAPRFTKFYIFVGQNLETGIDLDFRHGPAEAQPKFVPGLCNVCHGGTGSFTSTGDSFGRFIGFDLDSYDYTDYDPASGGPSSRSPFVRSAQEPQFAELNRGVLNTDPSYAYARLIGGWYRANPALQDSSYIPQRNPPLPAPAPAPLDDEWTDPAHQALYLQVIKPSCRSCHASRSTSLDWHSWDQIYSRRSSVHFRVCDQRDMPNAFVTWSNFWQSTLPSQSNLLRSELFPTLTCP